MFSKCKPVGGKLGITEFEKMVGMLSETEKQTKAQVDAQFGLDEREGVVDLTPESERRDFIAMKPIEKLESEDDEYFDDEEEEEMSVEEVFAELSNGKKTVTFDAISEWDVVDELIEEGALSMKVCDAPNVQCCPITCCSALSCILLPFTAIIHCFTLLCSASNLFSYRAEEYAFQILSVRSMTVYTLLLLFSTAQHFTLICLSLPSFTLPYLPPPYLILPCPTLPYTIVPYLTSPFLLRLILSYLALSSLLLPYLIFTLFA
jgi:hypothetical protein